MSIALNRLSRANRGKKITLPTEEDENFWNQEFFAEESEDGSINSSDLEDEVDILDEDFFENESEEEEVEDENEKDDDDGPKKKLAYVEPKKKKSNKPKKQIKKSKDKKSKIKVEIPSESEGEQSESGSEDGSKNSNDNQDDNEESEGEVGGEEGSESNQMDIEQTNVDVKEIKTVIKKTPAKRGRKKLCTETFNHTDYTPTFEQRGLRMRRPVDTPTSKPKKKINYVKKVYRELTQEEKLEESKYTEVENAISLKEILAIEENSKVKSKPKGYFDAYSNTDIPMIRQVSRKGFHGLVFFNTNPQIEPILPSILIQEIPEPVNHESKCQVSNQPAKYLDPLTRLPYSNVEAFKQIRQEFNSKPLQKRDWSTNFSSTGISVN